VAIDVKDGNVSLEWARKVYRVVLAPTILEPDMTETKRLREEAKQDRINQGKPILPYPPVLAKMLRQGRNTRQRLGENLYVERGVVYCRHCDGVISKASENAKLYCLLLKEELGIAGPWIAVQNKGKSKNFHFWEYVCPHCGAKLLWVKPLPKSTRAPP